MMKRLLNIIERYWKHPLALLARIAIIWPSLIRNDKLFLKLKFLSVMNYWPDLDNPRTFNEKIQWLKLHDRNPEHTKMVDKVEAKKIAESIIGLEYIIPTLAIYDRVEDIDFDALPNQFVLKCTHDSGGIVICRDKSILDKKATIKKLKYGLKKNFYYHNREWPYKNVKPRIIAEQYMEEKENSIVDKRRSDLIDYKFYCFDGEPLYVQVIQDRNTKETIDFFDMNWNHQKFVGLNPAATNAKILPSKPANFDQMKEVAYKLCKEMLFVRVDVYSISNKTYFGEITFFPNSGFGHIKPDNYAIILGDLIKLPDIHREV